MNYPIYLDHNATTPCAEEVIASMLPFFGTHFGNAASKSHPYGWVAEQAVEDAREAVAQLIGAKSKELIFTSGATESLNLAIKGVFDLFPGEKQHYITCQTEHKAVLDSMAEIQRRGAEVTYLPVNADGEVDLSLLEQSIQLHTKMICLMWANNETGVIYSIQEIAQIAEKHGIIFLTDAVQAVGKIPVHTQGIHLMALSAHKLYGPKGVGALYVRHNHSLPVAYLSPARDASVSYGHLDFKFANNTDGPIYMSVAADGKKFHIRLYGPLATQVPKVNVETTEPVYLPSGAYKVAAKRTIQHPDGRVETEDLGWDTYSKPKLAVAVKPVLPVRPVPQVVAPLPTRP